MPKALSKKENPGKFFTKLDNLISLYKKRGQKMLIFGAQLKRLEDRVARLESGQRK